MFNGIVESIGTITHLTADENSIHFTIHAPFYDLTIGESVAVNGVCLTVTEFAQDTFQVTCVAETLKVTNLSTLNTHDKVNLERSLKADGRISGHYVQGHVDCTGEIIDLTTDGVAFNATIQIPSIFMKYIVNKGYIALDGMSITIIATKENTFTVTFIPHTRQVTIIPEYRMGTKINIEVDILSKYVEKQFGERL
jgi:riboflavin synthase